MVRQRDVQGKIYTLKSRSECAALGVRTPSILHGHMVLVVDVVPDQAHHVKVMTITSSLKDEIDNYLPIAPLQKQPFPVQLQLQTHLTTDRGQTAVYIPTLDRYSYLKINESYDIPIQILNLAYDDDDVPLKILTKGKGGVGELRCHLRRRERARVQQAFEQMMDQLSLEE